MIIDEMSLLIGQLNTNPLLPKINNNERLNAVRELKNRLEEFSNNDSDQEIKILKNNLDNLLLILEGKKDFKNLEDIEHQFLENLSGRIKTLSDGLNAKEVTLEDIPVEIYQRWVNNGKYRIKILPKENLNDNNSMRNFVDQLQMFDKNMIGSPIVSIEAGNAVMNAFKSAFTYAFIAITLLLILLVKIKYDAMIILTSVLVGATFTFGLMVLFNIPLNFANIIGLPLLLGIGVDSGIHITERFYEIKDSKTNIYTTSTTRGVIVSTLTTIFSIGNLAFSSHQGTASMGLLLSLGLISMMVATMIILPSFLIWRNSLH